MRWRDNKVLYKCSDNLDLTSLVTIYTAMDHISAMTNSCVVFEDVTQSGQSTVPVEYYVVIKKANNCMATWGRSVSVCISDMMFVFHTDKRTECAIVERCVSAIIWTRCTFINAYARVCTRTPKR
jgi:hypothetical protein